MITNLTNASNSMFPPSPESPAVGFSRSNTASGTPRVGMLVNNAINEDDDDVSVLTFHTLGTKDTGASPIDWGARLDDKKGFDVRDEGIKKSLSHISEESQQSEEFKNTKSVKCNDDESISLAESVLDSTNKLLSSIGSSSYFSGLNSKMTLQENENAQKAYSPPPKPNAKHPSPVKLGSLANRGEGYSKEQKGSSPRKQTRSFALRDKAIFGERKDSNIFPCDSKTEQYQKQSHSDEPNENFNRLNLTERSMSDKKNSYSNKSKLRKMQAETKQLQLLLREKQLETKLAMSELDASIERANALLKKAV